MNSPEILPDIVKHGLDAIFCEINPGLCGATHGHHFGGTGNRFWKTMHMAGFTPVRMSPDEDARLVDYGYGLTSAVPRPSRSGDEVTATELQLGIGDLEAKVRQWKPRVVAFLGKPAWVLYTKAAQVKWGRQALSFGNAEVWLLPNPSRFNRHYSLAELVHAYRDLRSYLGSFGVDRKGGAAP